MCLLLYLALHTTYSIKIQQIEPAATVQTIHASIYFQLLKTDDFQPLRLAVALRSPELMAATIASPYASFGSPPESDDVAVVVRCIRMLLLISLTKVSDGTATSRRDKGFFFSRSMAATIALLYMSLLLDCFLTGDSDTSFGASNSLLGFPLFA